MTDFDPIAFLILGVIVIAIGVFWSVVEHVQHFRDSIRDDDDFDDLKQD